MDQVRPDFRNMQSMKLVDLIYPEYPDFQKKISQYLFTHINVASLSYSYYSLKLFKYLKSELFYETIGLHFLDGDI